MIIDVEPVRAAQSAQSLNVNQLHFQSRAWWSSAGAVYVVYNNIMMLGLGLDVVVTMFKLT